VHEQRGPLGNVRLQGGQQRVEGQCSCLIFFRSFLYQDKKEQERSK